MPTAPAIALSLPSATVRSLPPSTSIPSPPARWLWSPSLDLQRQNSATYNGSQHFTHWQDIDSTAFDLGYERGQRLRLRGGVEAGYEQLSAVPFPGALAAGDGAFIAPRLRADWNSLDDPSLPTRGALFAASMAARYRRYDGRTVPLGRASLEQHLPLLAGTVTASLSAASSFGVALNYFDLFPLGGPTAISAPSAISSSTPASYACGGLAYRRPLREFKLFGAPPQLGAWYEAAGLGPAFTEMAKRAERLARCVVQLAARRCHLRRWPHSDHQTRAWINVGRP